jgi:hypothetical protein
MLIYMPVQLAEASQGRDIDFQAPRIHSNFEYAPQVGLMDRSHLPSSLQNLWRETQNGLHRIFSQDTKVAHPTQPLFRLPIKSYNDRRGNMLISPFGDALEKMMYYQWEQEDRRYDPDTKKGELYWNSGQTRIAYVDLSDPAVPNVNIVLDPDINVSQARADAVMQALETEVLSLIARKDPGRDWKDLSILQGVDPYS